MNSWEQIFNKPDEPVIDVWAKMFKPEQAKSLPLDEVTCRGAIAFYGPDHELVKRHCKPKMKYKIIYK